MHATARDNTVMAEAKTTGSMCNSADLYCTIVHPAVYNMLHVMYMYMYMYMCPSVLQLICMFVQHTRGTSSLTPAVWSYHVRVSCVSGESYGECCIHLARQGPFLFMHTCACMQVCV